MPWLPADFEHPRRADLATGHHVRPIREADAPIDYPAVMGSQPRLQTIFGPAWGWPRAEMTYEEDARDLARHERENEAHESFCFAILDAAESEIVGCIYVDPPERAGADTEVAWWVVDDEVGRPLEAEVRAFVPRWLGESWPFTHPRVIGHDLTWADWLALPEIGAGDA